MVALNTITRLGGITLLMAGTGMSPLQKHAEIIFPTNAYASDHSSNHYGSPFRGIAIEGLPESRSDLEATINHIGLTPDLVLFFQQWPKPGEQGVFPSNTFSTVRSFDAIPILTWEPMYQDAGAEQIIDSNQITNGSYDSYLSYYAEKFKEDNRPIIIRFAHEMNFDRYHWGTGTGFGPESPRKYQEMFRYVVSYMRNAGVTNVKWAFCPNAESIPFNDEASKWNRIEDYYPGDDVVDIIGVDGYNWGSTLSNDQTGWRSSDRTFKEIFSETVGTLKNLGSGKPFIVFETASVEESIPKLQWFKDALQTAADWNLLGVVWFQVNKEHDWRLPEGAFKAVGKD